MSGGNGGPQYDAVIVGSGVSGSIIALELGRAGKKVLILEAGPAVPGSREEYMENFYLALAKTPEAPYPALAGRTAPPNSTDPTVAAGQLPDPSTLPAPRATVLALGVKHEFSHLIQPVGAQASGDDKSMRNMPFASTYERVGGGTANHWLGTTPRLVPHDLAMKSTYGVFHDWPVTYEEMQTLWARAETELGVAANVEDQAPLQPAIGLTYPQGYEYPMKRIPSSVVDETISSGVKGFRVAGDEDDPSLLYDVFVTNSPSARNSVEYQNRRVCAGNTNCIPICPIQAKWDPTVTLGEALDTGNVTVSYQSVANDVVVDANNNVQQVDYLQWSRDGNGKLTSEKKSVTGRNYVLAAHAIENAKLLLLSNNQQGIANRSDQVGRNLMDHVLYLAWALTDKPVWPYRGPMTTSGIESLRDGAFRSKRSAFRMEIGNEGWNFSANDPYTTTLDYLNGTNAGQLNPEQERLGGTALALKLNSLFTGQIRFGCIIDQAPEEANRVTIDPTYKDGLGIPRPHIDYGLDEYTMEGFANAARICSAIFKQMGATEYTQPTPPGQTFPVPGNFIYKNKKYLVYGAGHIMGTHRMGSDPNSSVVDASQKSHDVRNLWIVGSGSFPTVGTANPTLTIAALAFKSADSIIAALAS